MSVSGQSAQAAEPTVAQATVQEPSMEDILASIRKIIAADHSGTSGRNSLGGFARKAPAPVETAEPAPEPASSGVPLERPVMPPALDLSAAAASGPGSQPEPGQAPPVHAGYFEQSAHDSAAPSVSVAEPDYVEPAVAQESFELPDIASMEGIEPSVYELKPHERVSPPDADSLLSASVGASISSSFQALAETVLFQDPDTLERMAREALRPMLKQWLDENLPSMVERLVRAEIERVARGGRSRS